MSLQLYEEDRRAVDLLLDQQVPHQADGGLGHAFVAPGRSGLHERVEGIERLLRLLEQLPVNEPAGNLTSRTLQRLEELLAGEPAAGQPAPAPMPGAGRGAHA